MTSELYFSIVSPFLGVCAVVLLGFTVWRLILLPFWEKQEEKKAALDVQFHEKMRATIKKQLEEDIEQAIAKSVEIIREEQKKKE